VLAQILVSGVLVGSMDALVAIGFVVVYQSAMFNFAQTEYYALGGTSPILLAQFSMGQAILVKAFAVGILGGLSSIPGVIVGKLVVGIAENIAGDYVSAAYKDVVAFVVVIVVLAVRPSGILGARRWPTPTSAAGPRPDAAPTTTPGGALVRRPPRGRVAGMRRATTE
jgi:branched-subunit amino acid ABC-type transport system permease component